jgi:hypothetical protein
MNPIRCVYGTYISQALSEIANQLSARSFSVFFEIFSLSIGFRALLDTLGRTATAQAVLSQTHRLEEPAWKRDVQTAVSRIASLFYPNAALTPFDVAAPQEIQGSI